MLKVSVPATSANLGPGFDTLGIALDLHNNFYFCPGEEESPPGGLNFLSANSLVQRAVHLVSNEIGAGNIKWRVAIETHIPRSRGLGSSASLTVAGLVAANHYLKAGFSAEELLNLAISLEGHPDNAAPALLGGLVISIVTAEGVKYLKTMPGKPIRAVVAVPEFILPTVEARKVLPSEVSHYDAVKNTGRTALFVGAMLTGDYSHLRFAMEDVLHQPYRLSLVPGMDEVMQAAIDAGALGSCLSGAGPSMLAFVNERGQEVSDSMVEAWSKKGIQSKVYILNIATEGAKLSII